MENHVGSNPLDTNGLCLLSLDGGGVRGLSTLYILKDIMVQLNHERGDGQSLKPCDVFDLIGGTSTGGLIAIMLGRLEMGIDECILAYSELMQSVFGEKVNNLPVDWSGNIRAQYDSGKLRSAIEHVIERAGMGPSDPMDDGMPRRCRVFVCTTAKDTLQIARLRSYTVSNEDRIPSTICEAALATSAATGYFDTVSIGDRQFVDGAFGANNPVEELEEEAADIWCTVSRELKPLVKCFLSIGTGNPGQVPIDDNMIKFLSKTLVRMATKPESTERRFTARWSNELRENRFFRFNVERGLQDVRMTEYQKRSLIESATHDYLHHSAQKTRIRDCILNLASKDGKTDLDFDILVREYEARLFRQKVLKNIHGSKNPFRADKSPCWVVPFERNTRFVDREFLGKLKRRLFARHRSERIAIVGLGGVGKTQISLELAHQTREMYPDCAVFWVPAVDTESLHQAYQEIASQLGLILSEKQDVKRVVQRYLSQPHSGRWLLIFDNADELGMWTQQSPTSDGEGLREVLPQSDQGVVLFTTRSNRVAQYLASTDVIEIPEMDEHRATRVLKNLLVKKSLLNDVESTRKLLERLTFLPLAIVQAASFINENLMDISSYVNLLDGQGQDVIDLLSEDFEDEGRYKSIRNPVATTWLTSFTQIWRHNTLAFHCLAFMACINAKDIPISLLPPANPVEKEKALGTLSSYSFVRLRNAGSRIDMHRLVHLATRNWLSSVNALDVWQVHVLHQVTMNYPNLGGTQRNDWRVTLPHALQVLQFTFGQPATEARADLLTAVGLCTSLDGRFKESVDLFVQALESSEAVFGHEDYRTLRNRGYLARAYSGLGQFDKAEKMFEEVLHARERILGPESLDTTEAMSELATAYRLSGDLQKAEKLGDRVVRYYLKTLGPDNELAFQAIHGLALIYYAQGRLSDTEELALQALSIARKLYGPEDPRTTSAMSALADIYMERWRLKEAEALYMEALEKSRKILGPHHPSVLRVMHQLAFVIRLQKRHSEALAVLIECAQLSERVLGASHHSTLATYDLLGHWTSKKLSMRFKYHFIDVERSAQMISRRKNYPRVKVCGGLYKARREPKNDSLIREVKKAVDELPLQRQFSSAEVTLVRSTEDKKDNSMSEHLI